MSSWHNLFKVIIVPLLEMADISWRNACYHVQFIHGGLMATGQIEPCITGRYLVAFFRVTSLLRNIHKLEHISRKIE